MIPHTNLQYVALTSPTNPNLLSLKDQKYKKQFHPNHVVFSPTYQSLYLSGGSNQIGHFTFQQELNNVAVWNTGFNEPAKQLWYSNQYSGSVTSDPLIYSISSSCIRGWTQTGRVTFSCKSTEFENGLKCAIDDNDEFVYMGGETGKVWLWDLRNAKLVTTAASDDFIGVTKMQLTRNFLICAMANGAIQLRDKKSLEVLHTYPRHSGMITDIAARDDLIASCGLTMRGNSFDIDRQVQLLDIRMMKLLPGINFMHGPSFLRFHPLLPNKLLVVGRNGNFQWKELRETKVHAIHTIFTKEFQPYASKDPQHIVSFDISGSGEVCTFVDNTHRVHIWGTSPNTQIPNPMVFQQKIQPFKEYEPDYTHASLYMDEDTPLSVISTYEDEIYSRNGSLLSSMDMNSGIYFKTPRQINPILLNNTTKIDKFDTKLSTKVSTQVRVAMNPGLQSIEDGYLVKRRPNHKHKTEVCVDADRCLIPKLCRFRPSEIPGWETVDFRKFNQTQYTGLENTFEKGSLFNSFIQIMFHLNKSLRISIINHSCEDSECITCQLGHLFKMMEKKQGISNKTCFPGNFMRILNRKLSKQDKNDEGKLFDDKNHNTTPNVIHFLISAISSDLQKDELFMIPNKHPHLLSISKDQAQKRSISKSQSEKNLLDHYLSSLLGIRHQCTHCSKERYHESKRMFYRISLPSQTCTFEQAIQNSICNIRMETIKRKCGSCERYSCFKNISKCITLPNIFCFVFSDRGMDQLWLHQQYLVKNHGEEFSEQCIPVHKRAKSEKYSIAPKIVVSRADDSWKIQAIYDENHVEDDLYDPKNPQSIRIVYELRSFMCKVHHPLSEGKGHHVSFIRTEEDPQAWHLFNDFTISSQKSSIYDFTMSWKQANMLFYVRKEISNITLPIQRMEPIPITKALVGCDPIPKKGTLVAIDAEFVRLKSSNVLSLGRVSVIREDETVLLDDYVRLGDTEEVEDYLTIYSGLRVGDLDSTNKNALELNVVYKKLESLVEAGVIFVGHGLKNDFKIINIVVPPEQIRDTAEIFQLHKQRLIRLKFLSQLLLNMDVQLEEHDSVEDALTALRLYKKYLYLKEQNKFSSVLDHIYRIGRQNNWSLETWKNRENIPIIPSLENLPDGSSTVIHSLKSEEGSETSSDSVNTTQKVLDEIS